MHTLARGRDCNFQRHAQVPNIATLGGDFAERCFSWKRKLPFGKLSSCILIDRIHFVYAR